MRVQQCDGSNLNFGNQILKIGNGNWKQNENGEIEYDESICNECKTMLQLIDSIFLNIESNYKNTSWLSERAIITLRNETVDEINEKILEKIPGDAHCYYSIDTTVNEDEATLYPSEFLNSLNHSGIPQHCLKLKKGCLIILMRNLNPPNLCNGTKLIVTCLRKYTIEAEIITGPGIYYLDMSPPKNR